MDECGGTLSVEVSDLAPLSSASEYIAASLRFGSATAAQDPSEGLKGSQRDGRRMLEGGSPEGSTGQAASQVLITGGRVRDAVVHRRISMIQGAAVTITPSL